jgi:hypothetical protein
MSVQLCIPMNELYFITRRANCCQKAASGNKFAHCFKVTVRPDRLAWECYHWISLCIKAKGGAWRVRTDSSRLDRLQQSRDGRGCGTTVLYLYGGVCGWGVRTDSSRLDRLQQSRDGRGCGTTVLYLSGGVCGWGVRTDSSRLDRLQQSRCTHHRWLGCGTTVPVWRSMWIKSESWLLQAG